MRHNHRSIRYVGWIATFALLVGQTVKGPIQRGTVVPKRTVAAGGLTLVNTATAFDTDTDATATLSNFTVAGGANGLLVVQVLFPNDPTATVSSVTFGSDSLSQHSASGNLYRIAVWRIVNPTVQTATITVTVSASGNAAIAIIARHLTGAHQTTPLGTEVNRGGTSLNLSDSPLAPSSAVDDIVIDGIIYFNTPPTPTVGAGQTEVGAFGSGDYRANSSTEPGVAGTTTMSWGGGDIVAVEQSAIAVKKA